MQLSRKRGVYHACRRCLALLVLLLAACRADAELLPQRADPTPTPLPPEPAVEQPTYVVQRGAVTRELGFTARVAPVQEARLFFRTGGHVSRLHAQRGDRVSAGDVLAELAMADLQRSLATARLEWDQAQIAAQRSITRTQLTLQERQLALEEVRAISPDPNILRAETDLRAAHAAVEDAQREYLESLDRAWETADERQRYADLLTQAQTALALAQAEYDAAVKWHAYDLRRLQLAVQQATLDAEEATEGADPRLAQQVAQLEARVAEHQLIAPFDGLVLALTATPGDQVGAYDPVLVVGDPAALELRADLTADQVDELEVGQPVRLLVSDVGGTAFSGTIRQLPYGWGGDVEETDRAVHITPEGGAPDMDLGELVRATVVLEHRENVLWLPPAAIQTFRGRTFVFILEEDGTQRRADVVLGIESDERVEIVTGVERFSAAGDKKAIGGELGPHLQVGGQILAGLQGETHRAFLITFTVPNQRPT
jgi:multidrug efflux pump subunit AcrA (membrane-fusion protein)